MDDILIKNIGGLPEDGDLTLTITPKGEIILGGCIYTHNFGKEVKAVALPEHGRIIDADRLADEYMRYLMVCFPTMQMSTANELVSAVKEAIKIAPTIVEETE